jgi:hypothetical protein
MGELALYKTTHGQSNLAHLVRDFARLQLIELPFEVGGMPLQLVGLSAACTLVVASKHSAPEALNHVGAEPRSMALWASSPAL